MVITKSEKILLLVCVGCLFLFPISTALQKKMLEREEVEEQVKAQAYAKRRAEVLEMARVDNVPNVYLSDSLFYSVNSKFVVNHVIATHPSGLPDKRKGVYVWSSSKRTSTQKHRSGEFYLYRTNSLGRLKRVSHYNSVIARTKLSEGHSARIDLQNRKGATWWLNMMQISSDYSFLQRPASRVNRDFPIYGDSWRTRYVPDKNRGNWPLIQWMNFDPKLPNYMDQIVHLSRDDQTALFAGVDDGSKQPRLFRSKRGVWQRQELPIDVEPNRTMFDGGGRLRFSPDGRYLAFTVAQKFDIIDTTGIRSPYRCYIYVFDIAKGRIVQKIRCLRGLSEFVFSMDSRCIVTAEAALVLTYPTIPIPSQSRLIDVGSGRVRRTVTAKQCGLNFLTRVAFAPNGREYALAGSGPKDVVRFFPYSSERD